MKNNNTEMELFNHFEWLKKHNPKLALKMAEKLMERKSKQFIQQVLIMTQKNKCSKCGNTPQKDDFIFKIEGWCRSCIQKAPRYSEGVLSCKQLGGKGSLGVDSPDYD